MTKVEAKSHEKSVGEVEEAVDAYVNGRASLGGAAEIAGIPYCDFREELRKRGLLSKRKIGLTWK
jgi:predicted HTH domain antitoxin